MSDPDAAADVRRRTRIRGEARRGEPRRSQVEQMQPRQWGHNPKPKPAQLRPKQPLEDVRYLVEVPGYRTATMRIARSPKSNYRVLQMLNTAGDEWNGVALVMPDGDIQPNTYLSIRNRLAIEALADDPAPNKLAERYAIATGTCFVCGRDLTDPVSVAQGIGPECAAKRSIPRISEQEAETRIAKRRANAVAA
jgi:hypothetical protein